MDSTTDNSKFFENTRAGWAELRLPKSTQGRYTFETALGTRDDATGELMNLRYYFQAVDRAIWFNACKTDPDDLTKLTFIFLIHLTNDDDLYRLQVFLNIQARMHPCVEIWAKKRDENAIAERIYSPQIIGNLIPLLHIAHDSVAPQYGALPFSKLANGKGRLTAEDIATIFEEIGPSDKTRKHLSLSKYFSGELGALREIAVENLVGYILEFSGYLNSRLNKVTLSAMRSEAESFFISQLPEVPLLVQVLWITCLRQLNRQHELIGFQEKMPILYESNFQKARQDAVSYAEGLMQLIENSCQYTQRRVAYLGIRIHNVSTERNKQLVEHVQTLVMLEKNGTLKTSTKWTIPPATDYCLELRILDDSLDDRGLPINMMETYNTKRPESEQVSSLQPLFHLEAKTAEDIICHYGLRLFRKIVVTNAGKFAVSTPLASGTQYYISSAQDNVEETVQSELSKGTEYKIVIPITYRLREGQPMLKPSKYCPLFDNSVITHSDFQVHCLRYNFKCDNNSANCTLETESLLPLASSIHHTIDSPLFETPSNKFELVKKLSQQMSDQLLSFEILNNPQKIILLDVTQCRYGNIEILAKSLFYLLYNRADNAPNAQIALYFHDEQCIYQFVRMFSIFYSPQGIRKQLAHIQIALCAESEGDIDPLPEVKLILTGDNIQTASHTARTFAYYNSAAALRLIPAIDYLTSENLTSSISLSQEEYEVAQFPFDLYLNTPLATTDSHVEMKPSTLLDSWFMRFIYRQVERDFQEKNVLGCKISGIDIRLGSKIHIGDFYEAELLFHNIGVVYRFAILLAQNIYASMGDLPLIIVGYESYSELLIDQISKILTEVAGCPTQFAICTKDKTGNYAFQQISCEPTDQIPKKHVLILPIGATLGTLYEMQRCVQSALHSQSKTPVFEQFVLFLVGDQNSDSELQGRYWSLDEKIVTLKPNQKGAPVVTAQVLFLLKTKWGKPPTTQKSESEADHIWNEKIQVYVDKTSTLPNQIFALKGSSTHGAEYYTSTTDSVNNQRLRLLKNCIRYGHLLRGENHFQYTIDFQKYFTLVNNKPIGEAEEVAPYETEKRQKSDFHKWLQKCREEIDTNAFHIVISPLHEKNSEFVKSVADYVFDHSTRFLHFEINSVMREDVRTKFSSVAGEFRCMRRSNPMAKIHVYFVDDSIVSGHTINRARIFLSMLMHESGIDPENFILFQGVFVLVNRSSVDTIRSIVESETNFYAYVHLAIPNFNTNGGDCPICQLKEKYTMLETRSVTNSLSGEFHRLATKHQLQTFDEYDTYRHTAWKNQPGWFAKLSYWLYRHPQGQTDKLTEMLSGWRTKWIQEQVADTSSIEKMDEFLEWMEQTATFAKCSDDDFSSFIPLLKEVAAERDYLRLECTHRAYCALAKVPETDGDMVEYAIQTILDLLMKECGDTTGTPLSKLDCIEKTERLISYIKVFSRKNLSRTYHVKQAICTILIKLLLCLINNSEYLTSADSIPFVTFLQSLHIKSGANKDEQKWDDAMPPSLKYQLLITICAQLADMQISLLAKEKYICEISAEIECLQAVYYAKWKVELDANSADLSQCLALYHRMPSRRQISLECIKTIKWASMSSDDESRCFLVEDSLDNICQGEES